MELKSRADSSLLAFGNFVPSKNLNCIFFGSVCNSLTICTYYQAFDEMAKTRNVFKVETIGDCYVAVTGLPEPNKRHAVDMCRFARDCLHRMHNLTKSLEVTLGPDTSDLNLRIGLHSGAVTAGVLRGEKSRFQLFGDTMNTASRMESTGQAGKIQISQDTADQLDQAGKTDWFEPRENTIHAKGKGAQRMSPGHENGPV